MASSREYMREWYSRNADAQRAKARANTAARRVRNQCWVHEYLSGSCCAVCGLDDMRLLTFNHIDPSQKLHNVSDLVSKGRSLKLVAEEVAKCEILCHNCHMLATFNQLGGSYHEKLLAVVAKTET